MSCRPRFFPIPPISSLLPAYFSQFLPQATKCWGGPNIQFCTNESRSPLRKHRMATVQKENKLIARPQFLFPLSISSWQTLQTSGSCDCSPQRPFDSPCAELPHTSVGDQTLPSPQRWSQVGPSYKKEKLPPSLTFPFAFCLPFTRTLPHIHDTHHVDQG